MSGEFRTTLNVNNYRVREKDIDDVPKDRKNNSLREIRVSKTRMNRRNNNASGMKLLKQTIAHKVHWNVIVIVLTCTKKL